MENQKITLQGKTYPARSTFGARILFERTTGKEFARINVRSLDDLSTYLYCCLVKSCRADNVDFPYSLEQFQDEALSEETMTQWIIDLNAGKETTEGEEEGKKKH